MPESFVSSVVSVPPGSLLGLFAPVEAAGRIAAELPVPSVVSVRRLVPRGCSRRWKAAGLIAGPSHAWPSLVCVPPGSFPSLSHRWFPRWWRRFLMWLWWRRFLRWWRQWKAAGLIAGPSHAWRPWCAVPPGSFFGLVASLLAVVEPLESGSATATAPPAPPISKPAASTQTPAAKRKCDKPTICSPAKRQLASRPTFAIVA